MAETTAAFVPLASSVTPSFWTEFARQKLEVLKLDDRPFALTASYTHERTARDRQTGADIGLGSLLSFDASSFSEPSSSTCVSPSVDGLTDAQRADGRRARVDHQLQHARGLQER